MGSHLVWPFKPRLFVLGHYCLNGTSFPTQYPCPVGYFNNATGKQSLDDCMPCTAGSYCGTTGLSEPTGPCDNGWYCVRAAVSSKPYDIGNTSYSLANVTVNCFCSINETGGMCAPGEYCPLGSARPIICDGGRIYIIQINLNFLLIIIVSYSNY